MMAINRHYKAEDTLVRVYQVSFVFPNYLIVIL